MSVVMRHSGNITHSLVRRYGWMDVLRRPWLLQSALSASIPKTARAQIIEVCPFILFVFLFCFILFYIL